MALPRHKETNKMEDGYIIGLFICCVIMIIINYYNIIRLGKYVNKNFPNQLIVKQRGKTWK